MSRYNSTDFGYDFASEKKVVPDERQPLVPASAKASKTKPDTSGSPDIIDTKPSATLTTTTAPGGTALYELYEEPTAATAATTTTTTDREEPYRYPPVKRNRGGESYLSDDGGGGGGVDVNPVTCVGACCCLVTAALLVTGGVLLSVVNSRGSDPKILVGSLLLVVSAGTCLCGCVALCVGPAVGGGGGGGLGGGGGKDEKEVKVRFRRLNDRFEKGCMEGEECLQRIRLDVVGHMKEIKQAANKEDKQKKETDKKNLTRLEERVKKDIESGLPTSTIRKLYRPVTFFLTFHGDLHVSTLELLRKQVSLVVNLSRPSHDRCCISLTSPGGSVTAYGLAASQLVRIRNAGVHLTVCVDSVAASGGYMMASVADVVVAAPFAMVGSIGVVTQIPNFQRFLEDKKVDAYLMTAGEYKRTIDVIGEVTEEGKEKLREELDDVHAAFKDHVSIARPGLRGRMEEVGTGEHWLAVQAKEKGLVDVIMTSDEYLESICEEYDIIEILEKKERKQPIADLLGEPFGAAARSVKSVVDQFQSTGKSKIPMTVM